MKDIYRRSEFIFSRIDHYLEVVNTKGAVYLTINTFFIGAFLASLDALVNKFEVTEVTAFILGAFLFLCFVSILLVMLAINPFLRGGVGVGQNPSVFYYGSVSSYDKETYRERLIDIPESELKDDLATQIYCLSKALRAKYLKLEWAGKLIMAEFFLLIPITILLSINLK